LQGLDGEFLSRDGGAEMECLQSLTESPSSLAFPHQLFPHEVFGNESEMP